MKRILCYGDSNTYGSNPDGGRWDEHTRWPGLLSDKLGFERYRVIEEGMGGRTTIWDDPIEPNRNGLAALPISLQSHRPLDLVVIALGTNDCKTHLNASPKLIARGAEMLVDAVRTYRYGDGYPVPRILLVSPIHIAADVADSPFVSFDYTSHEKSLALAPLFRQVAERTHAAFFDASAVAIPSTTDRLHMDAQSHRNLALALLPLVRTLLGN